MSYWHEIARTGAHSRVSCDLKTRQIIGRTVLNPNIFEAYFLRQKNKGLFPPHDESIQLWPLEAITALTAQEAMDKAQVLLEFAADGNHDELFEKRPCPVPVYLKKVKEILFPSQRASAQIYKHDKMRYEIRYFGDIIGEDDDDGWRLAVPNTDNMPVARGFELLTIADSLEGAEQIAFIELELIVARDDIKPR